MRVSAPLDSSTRAVLADWVELQVLLSDGPIAEQQLLRSQAVQSDPEHGDVLSNLDLEPVDEEILEPAADELSQRVNEELTYRQSTLGSLYPFEITFEYGSWILGRRDATDDSEEAAHGTYVCCLLIAQCTPSCCLFRRCTLSSSVVRRSCRLCHTLLRPRSSAGALIGSVIRDPITQTCLPRFRTL